MASRDAARFDVRGSVRQNPDPNDSHVIEAALECKTSAICTLDDWGFPDGVMRRLGIETLSPDELLLKLIDRAPA